MTTNAQQLEQLLEYTFRDQTLLVQALTHPSYLHEASGSDGGDYQRLEFLGDAVLGLLLAELLYVRYPDWDEGALSQLRSRLAGQDVLADRARWLGIGDFVLLGRGEEQSEGEDQSSEDSRRDCGYAAGSRSQVHDSHHSREPSGVCRRFERGRNEAQSQSGEAYF